ncbi:hypothetical protein SGPA1_50369 [Streptomyces misionensis JCM 4497]
MYRYPRCGHDLNHPRRPHNLLCYLHVTHVRPDSRHLNSAASRGIPDNRGISL